MHDIPLNDTQRIFAEKNHNLVYKFLHKKNLPASEYYESAERRNEENLNIMISY